MTGPELISRTRPSTTHAKRAKDAASRATMKTAVRIGVVALALSFIAFVTPFWLNHIAPWIRPDAISTLSREAAMPPLVVAFVAFMVALGRRGRPDEPLPRVARVVLVALLVLSAGWLLLYAGTWGL